MSDNSGIPRRSSERSNRPAIPGSYLTSSQRRAAAGLPPARRNWRRIPLRVFVVWLLRAGCIMAIIFGVVAAVYLTDRKSPDLRTIEWLPKSLHGIVVWADYHGRFRNTPAYGLLALPFLILLRTPRSRAIAMMGVAIFAAVMEFSQLFIPTRIFDLADIYESWLGQAIAWVLMEGVYWVIGRLVRLKHPSRSLTRVPAGRSNSPHLSPPRPHAPDRKRP